MPLAADAIASTAGPIEAASIDAASTLRGVFGTTKGYATIQTHSPGTKVNDASDSRGTPAQSCPAAMPNAPATSKTSPRSSSRFGDSMPLRDTA